MTVQSGSASAVANGNQLNITASHNAVLNWQSFNIAAGQTTTFIQPSASSIVWNRINDSNPSQLYGNLTANGVVVLMNQNGFYFGPNSFVSAAGLIVSTAPFGPVDSSAGLFWQFAGPPPSASIINYGQINVGKGGSAFLIAERIENHGRISAPEGSIGLIAGQEVLLSERPDGRGLSATVKLPTGSVDNSGQLVADAGAIALEARVVNQGGLVQANSIRERNGIIELIASDSITLGDDSVISANGDATAVSSGGEITIKSEGVFNDSASSQINVAGGGVGGNGGFVEVSAPLMSSVNSRIDGSAVAGGIGGRLLIDPLNITIGNSGSGGIGSGTVGSGDEPAAGTLSLNVNSAFVGFSQITLQALNNITISSGTIWDLVASTGINAPGSLLKLEAGNNITIGNGASILGGDGWSVTLQAGRNFSLADAVTSGVGTISFSGTGSLETRDGNISLLAGNNITLASGHVRTVNGGSITATALGGSINTGTKANGFLFLPTGYLVHSDLGGISTANGGDVTLTAGLDITSYLPVAGGVQSDAGSGAFGELSGNVTINAGRDVSGHYVVRNGVGSITAGQNAGTASRLLALSVVNGGWTVNAAQDVLLQEVRNPNGVFNNLGSSTSPNRYRFDYAPDAYTILNGGNSVQLRGTALPRYTDTFSQNLPPIYPGTLKINAGAGGVTLGNDVILFPSALGNLEITTTDGGSLVGSKSSGLTQLIVSDSGKTQYKAAGDFGVADHASVPIHWNDPEPVRLNISGNMEAILLGSPKRAEINIGGNMINSRFDGQNLRDSDVTSVNVAGDVINRNIFTSVTLDSAPNFALFDPLLNLIYPPLTGSAAGVQNQFFYNAATRVLTFQGKMTGEQLQALLNLRIRTFDAGGTPILDANGEPVTKPAVFVSATALQQLYAASQDVPTNPDSGYRLGGGGQFNFTARNMDLGATVGIVSQGPRGNAALANYFTEGADINVALSGNLDMFSTRIASLNGGDITIYADGSINAGSREFTAPDTVARGIFTSGSSDVTVIARGDVNVNGSRIAAYDGGDVWVKSLEGDVDAGAGGSGAATVEKIYVDPVTRKVHTYAPTIPGSGILATTFPPSLDPAFPRSRNTVGDILVETPRGDIIASSGGIVQIPLNGVG
ncbi:MAG TPA: filamentous hemagglutinin N-terminal domain-containing protein, partial [Verrucomicrobiae bacterium]|nr:filamentous hemagglutinin N-terminal domain-containing protein [Verrucomicrobiae bacterium]